MDTLEQNDTLAEIVAEKLAGKDKTITLQFKAPAVAAAMASTTKTKNNGFYISIDPSITQEEQFLAFCHEVAHVKRHKFIENDTPGNMPPRSIDLTPEEIDELGFTDHQEEIEADSLADVWIDFAEKNYKSNGRGEIQGRLVALLDWTEGDNTRILTALIEMQKSMTADIAKKDAEYQRTAGGSQKSFDLMAELEDLEKSKEAAERVIDQYKQREDLRHYVTKFVMNSINRK